MLIIYLLLLFSPLSYGKVIVAYIEMNDANGKIIQLEPNGQFAHMAISYKDKWLHAYPYNGVELITEEQLNKIGRPVKISYDFIDELSESEVKKFLGAPYDEEFSWKNKKIYCAELVAKLLGIKPLPMKFSLPIWKEMRKKSYDRLGLSPDDIYRIMQKRQQENKNQCTRVFES